MRKVLVLAALLLVGCSSGTSTPTPAPATSTPMPTPAPATATTSSAPVTSSPAPASGPQTIHLIEHPDNVIDQGGTVIGIDPVFDATTGKQVGTVTFECRAIAPGGSVFYCPGVIFTLTDRGQIVFTETVALVVGTPPTIWPITGGTGEFLGATGTVTSQLPPSGNGDFVIKVTK
jgi:hypothetical protein